MSTFPAEKNASASHTFFSTPELLEGLLLEVSLRDLLVAAQRVNRSWHEMVASSPVLQQKLFFQPCPEQEDRGPEFNPLLQQAFPPFFEIPPGDRFRRGEPFKALQWNKNSTTQNAYARREASWRRMLPMQTPSKTLQVIKHSSYMGGSFKKEGDVQFQDGVRMGALYDWAQEAVAITISSFVRIDEFLHCYSYVSLVCH
jgi:hypothetical protein